MHSNLFKTFNKILNTDNTELEQFVVRLVYELLRNPFDLRMYFNC